MAHDDIRASREHDDGLSRDPTTIGAGGPGFAPDFAGASAGSAEFGRARHGGDLTTASRQGFEKVTLRRTPDQGDRRRALFEREDSGASGPHMLNRAFSGTYPEER